MIAYGRFRNSKGDIFYGEYRERDKEVIPLDGVPWLQPLGKDPLERYSSSKGVYPLYELTILPPVTPSKIVAIGKNYKAHAAEFGGGVPKKPLTWLKAPSSLLAHNGVVEIPFTEHRTDFEAELAFVIGKMGKNISRKDALSYVFGYFPSLDISDREIQKEDGQYYRAKSFDTFTPVGPFIYAGGDIDSGNLDVRLEHNGELRQKGNTRDLIFPIDELISFISEGTTLLPGDIVLTGTPSGVGPISDGDDLEVKVGKFAPLKVKVKAAPVIMPTVV